MWLQLLLLGKAVVVALLAEEVVFPGQQPGQCGLLAMYLAICYSIVGIAVQYYTAETLIAGEPFRCNHGSQACIEKQIGLLV